MSQEVEVLDVVTNQNYEAAHSVMVMEQWGGGEIYNEDRWIERARQAARKTLEGMFELGGALIVLKEHTEHGRFQMVTEQELGIHYREAACHKKTCFFQSRFLISGGS